jgi:hypothetical protein
MSTWRTMFYTIIAPRRFGVWRARQDFIADFGWEAYTMTMRQRGMDPGGRFPTFWEFLKCKS